MMARNIIAALLLSVTLTVLLAFVYTFYPLMASLLSSTSGSAESAGMGAVAGGVSLRFLTALVIVEPLLFLAFLTILKRRSARARQHTR